MNQWLDLGFLLLFMILLYIASIQDLKTNYVSYGIIAGMLALSLTYFGLNGFHDWGIILLYYTMLLISSHFNFMGGADVYLLTSVMLFLGLNQIIYFLISMIILSVPYLYLFLIKRKEKIFPFVPLIACSYLMAEMIIIIVGWV